MHGPDCNADSSVATTAYPPQPRRTGTPADEAFAISGGSDERIGDFAEENLGCLGTDAFEALQPLADFLS
jgi:hypothetical protein